MTRDPTFGADVIQDQFHELAERLDEPTTVYLIGGGALTLSELKNATRDIDLIVESTDVSDRLYRALRTANYEPLDDPEAEYDDLEAAFIVQQGPRRFDVFNRQVAGVLQLSESMRNRSEHLFEDGQLTVRMISLDDIFLFKSVANRQDDVDDMIDLARSGIDEDVIMDEVMVQLDLLGDDQFVRSMKHKLDRLREQDISLNIHDEVDELYDSIQEADDVENTLFSIYDAEYRSDDLYEGVPRDRLREQVDADTEVQAALDWLERTGRIRVAADDTLVPLDDV